MPVRAEPIDRLPTTIFTRCMETLSTLRARLNECRDQAAPLVRWRVLQLELLEAVRRWPSSSRESVWAILGEGFWFEQDPDRVATLIEAALVELERNRAAASAE